MWSLPSTRYLLQVSWNLQFWWTLPSLSLVYTQFVWFLHGNRKDLKRNYAFLQYDLYGHTLAPLLQGSWNLLFRQTLPCLSLLYVQFVWLMPRSWEIFFKEIPSFYTFYPQIISSLDEGSRNLKFLVSLSYKCYLPNLVKICLVVLKKKLLTDDARRTASYANS